MARLSLRSLGEDGCGSHFLFFNFARIKRRLANFTDDCRFSLKFTDWLAASFALRPRASTDAPVAPKPWRRRKTRDPNLGFRIPPRLTFMSFTHSLNHTSFQSQFVWGM